MGGPHPPRRLLRNSKKEDVAARAREIIKAEGKPIPRADLFKRLVAAGMIIEVRTQKCSLQNVVEVTRYNHPLT
jgi:hypothetical protein